MVNSEKIYATTVDGANGIIIVDPNAISKNGELEYRYIKAEDLVIYVSVQAQMNPKTQIYNNAEGAKTVNVASAKFYSSTAKNIIQGVESITGPTIDRTHLTTAWSDMYSANSPSDIEGFGISSIDIEVNASLVPKVHIEFIDVRGKNLLERANDDANPYNVFYTMPYPLFQLTVKGYLGKAIEIPLVMEKAMTRFDPSTGSYIISADFKSWTFAILNDAVLLYPLLVEKMYENPDGSFEGAKLVEEKYTQYYDSDEGKQDIAEMRSLGYTRQVEVGEGVFKELPLDHLGSLMRLFLLSNEMGSLIKDDLLVQAKSRNSAVTAFMNEVDSFKESLGILSIKKSGFDLAVLRKQLDALVIQYNEYFKTQKRSIIKLTDLTWAEANFSIDVFDITLNATDYVNDDDTLRPMSDEEYDSIKNDILGFERERQGKDASDFQVKITKQFNFYPSVKNVVKAIVFHMDAFMELLKRKSELVISDLSTNAVDITDPTTNHEVVEIESGKYRRLPWPEFYALDKDNVGHVKGYPGNGTAEQQKWGEVKFIDEMYKASNLIHDHLAQTQDGTISRSKLFLLTPLSEPNLLGNLSATKDIPPNVMNRLYQQILDMVFHNGLLYRSMDEENQATIYDIMIKNVINLMLEDLKLSTNGGVLLNLLKSQLAANTLALTTFINKDITAFDNAEIGLGSSIENHLKFVDKPHTYESISTFAAGNSDFDKFKTIYKSKNDKKELGISKLNYLPEWGKSLNLFDFNTITLINGQPTTALTFTNNYYQDDMFITRKTYQLPNG